MSALILRLRQSIHQRIDMSPFTPERLADMKLADIVQLPLWQGNQQVACGDLFTLSGDDPQDIVIQSDSDRLDEIGSGMTNGSIHIEGCAGAYLGRSMGGGSLSVSGDVGIAAGCNMSAGTLTIAGNAGDLLGGAITGERQGMRGGKIIVKGNTGDRAGDQMRRGTILISGNAGDYCASRMIAGTLVVLGEAGAKTGLAMRRGTLLLSQEPVSLPATFNDNGKHNLNFLTLLTRSFQDQAGFSDMWERGSRVQRWLGDLGCDGKGEILVWC
ncbi:MAG: formylmethanofuran dehydrogenase subunit C [Candidatus Thiodiazotropha sp. (ex Lucinoma annulata)]|nr:formylmethanofuran dehydrogenase subunit C [Candidatus Thiodiazotropha sp. (ex Lucinoma borealis)]MCU7885129.1 formylmethanofuran dehydrogenase subunit C [Candidatus Thiodiazotropha sp. (ex Lucinoma annulata)]MCU7947654.1 formylmethanofuran dehydrogenase subunit C [Candidatus Thiodiazotropha sp. (ex Cardiolucina cf. quadrata)]